MHERAGGVLAEEDLWRIVVSGFCRASEETRDPAIEGQVESACVASVTRV